jgi:hypothetical protein
MPGVSWISRAAWGGLLRTVGFNFNLPDQSTFHSPFSFGSFWPTNVGSAVQRELTQLDYDHKCSGLGQFSGNRERGPASCVPLLAATVHTPGRPVGLFHLDYLGNRKTEDRRSQCCCLS